MNQPCLMCKKEFDAAELDFVGRCEPCFKLYMELPDDKRPELGVPFTPAYNSDKRFGGGKKPF